MKHLLPLALELTESRHRFSVWDNASRDGSWPVIAGLAQAHPERVRAFRSLQNRRHGTGLELALARTDRELVVMLDCDATPLREGWIEELARPVLDGAAASGISAGERDFVHPSCLCTTRSVLRELRVDVRPDYPRYDVAERLSVAARSAGRPLSFVDPDGDCLFDGWGQTFGEALLYHHWSGTRVNPVAGMGETPEGRTTAGLRESQRALAAWLAGRDQLRTAEPGGTLLHTFSSVARAHGPAWLGRR